jgi:predicted transcriptional regulator
MPKELPSLGELELQVLQLIWREQPCSERQVWNSIQTDRKAGRTTVLKTMQRLEAKGFLTRVPDSSPVQFRAAVEPERFWPALVKRFVQGSLGGSFAPLAAYLANQGKLSAKDLAALKAIVRKLDDGTDEKD